MEPYLGKRYKLKSSENFEEFLKALGIGLLSRKTACALYPVSSLLRNQDGSYTFTMDTPIRSTTLTFHLDEEFEEERADGVKVKTVVTLEGTTLVQMQVDPKTGKKSRIARTFTPDQLIVVNTIEGWDGVCTRIYNLVE